MVKKGVYSGPSPYCGSPSTVSFRGYFFLFVFFFFYKGLYFIGRGGFTPGTCCTDAASVNPPQRISCCYNYVAFSVHRLCENVERMSDAVTCI